MKKVYITATINLIINVENDNEIGDFMDEFDIPEAESAEVIKYRITDSK